MTDAPEPVARPDVLGEPVAWRWKYKDDAAWRDVITDEDYRNHVLFTEPSDSERFIFERLYSEASVIALTAELDEAREALRTEKERWRELWNKPDMTDPKPNQTLEAWWKDIPYRGEWVVPGVIARVIERAQAEALATKGAQVNG